MKYSYLYKEIILKILKKKKIMKKKVKCFAYKNSGIPIKNINDLLNNLNEINDLLCLKERIMLLLLINKIY